MRKSSSKIKKRKWIPAADMVLSQLWQEGKKVKEIAEIMNRTEEDVRRRLTYIKVHKTFEIIEDSLEDLIWSRSNYVITGRVR